MKMTACSNSAGVQADVLPNIIRQNMYRLQEIWKNWHQIFMSRVCVCLGILASLKLLVIKKHSYTYRKMNAHEM